MEEYGRVPKGSPCQAHTIITCLVRLGDFCFVASRESIRRLQVLRQLSSVRLWMSVLRAEAAITTRLWGAFQQAGQGLRTGGSSLKRPFPLMQRRLCIFH